MLSFLYSPTLNPYMTTGKTIALTRRAFVGKVMSLLFNMLSRLVITFLPRSEHLLISFRDIKYIHTALPQPSLLFISGLFHPDWNSEPFKEWFSISLHHNPWQPPFYVVFAKFVILGTSNNWNHTIFFPLYLAYFTYILKIMSCLDIGGWGNLDKASLCEPK